MLPIRDRPGEWARCSAEPASAFEDYFHDDFSPNPHCWSAVGEVIEKDILTRPDVKTSVESVSVNKVHGVNRIMRNREAPGLWQSKSSKFSRPRDQTAQNHIQLYLIPQTDWFPLQWKYATIIVVTNHNMYSQAYLRWWSPFLLAIVVYINKVRIINVFEAVKR